MENKSNSTQYKAWGLINFALGATRWSQRILNISDTQHPMIALIDGVFRGKIKTNRK